MNLVLRFVLEIVGLVAIGWWGWSHGSGASKYVLAFGLPAMASVVWGVFAVPDDPSRSGKAPIPVPGLLRLFLEITFFSSASLALLSTGATMLAIGYFLVVVGHHLASTKRILWLIRQ